MPPAIGERLHPHIIAVEPNHIEGHIAGARRALSSQSAVALSDTVAAATDSGTTRTFPGASGPPCPATIPSTAAKQVSAKAKFTTGPVTSASIAQPKGSCQHPRWRCERQRLTLQITQSQRDKKQGGRDGRMSLAMILSSAVLGISLAISAVKLIDGFVRADPRALIQMGSWLLCLALIAAGPCLIVLLIYQQWAPAMMLVAGVLIVLTLLNWRAILTRLDLNPLVNGDRVPEDHGRPRPDQELARRAAVVLEDYLAYIGSSERTPRAVEQRHCLSTEEALDVLGLAQGASVTAIRAAHRRLMQLVHPDHGGTTYLAARINEAKDILLTQAAVRRPRRPAVARQRGNTEDG